MKNFLDKYKAIKTMVNDMLDSRFPNVDYYVTYYTPKVATFEGKKNEFKLQVFFRNTDHEAYIAIQTNFSYKTMPVFWNELEYVHEGYQGHEVIPTGVVLSTDQIKEYFPAWLE